MLSGDTPVVGDRPSHRTESPEGKRYDLSWAARTRPLHLALNSMHAEGITEP